MSVGGNEAKYNVSSLVPTMHKTEMNLLLNIPKEHIEWSCKKYWLEFTNQKAKQVLKHPFYTLTMYLHDVRNIGWENNANMVINIFMLREISAIGSTLYWLYHINWFIKGIEHTY